ncbi:hypothetical protein C8250_042560 [Streptomyces sp. So13.3]|uniref:hypothetical protein n=1 Tax=Streptomyces TaxID=1883 RepID=UPI001106B2E6|nr:MULTISPECIES: hypothetical protein [Streptomyces]MCZ4103523.1 hypothetical protein [Streptomyces sp. H39-C1]QNA77570.1 hypothetical protein C8250_042560 [Streptomyces sp. So13.3]
MTEHEDDALDLGSLVVPGAGSLVATDDPWEPYRLLDPCGLAVGSVREYLKDLQAAGRSSLTQRSYGMDLLRWFRFLLWAIGIPWNEATRIEARDFSRWIQITAKPTRPHWRSDPADAVISLPVPAKAPNAVTGKRPVGRTYASSTIAHSETVLRGFYFHHLEAGTGPLSGYT